MANDRPSRPGSILMLRGATIAGIKFQQSHRLLSALQGRRAYLSVKFQKHTLLENPGNSRILKSNVVSAGGLCCQSTAPF
eukprot:scaffold134489_cov31-Prasinocladus_malaysianus.AAC.1